MTSQEVATRTPQQALAAQIHEDERVRAQIVAVLPENVGFERFARVAGIALLENPDLVGADRTSFFTALVKCAADGLVPDSRQAALVIYKGQVSYQPMIHGLRDAVAEYGWDLVTGVVHANDEFDYDDSPPKPWVKHRKPRLGSDRGERIGAWAFATKRDTMPRLVVLDADDVAKCKAKARTDKFWKDWPEAMWAKTAGKKLAKNLPLGERETERIRRLLDENGQLEPAPSLKALYGPSTADEARPEVSPQPPDPGQAKGPVGTGGGETGSQAASTPSSPPEGAGGSGPDVDWTALDPEPAPEPKQETRAAAAGEAVVPDGHFAGKTLTQVAATGKQGLGWLLNALKMLPTGDPTRAAVETYVRGEQPDVWQQFEEWQAAEQAGDEAFGDSGASA